MHIPPFIPFHRFHSFLCKRFLAHSEALATATPLQPLQRRRQRKKRNIRDPHVLTPAKQALTDYLYTTRSLFFTYADNISKHSPSFLQSLLSNLKLRRGHALRDIQHYLLYNPINEYRPFLESIGIAAPEVPGFLPHDRLFLSENPNLLNSLSALCSYGFPWTKLGVLYKHDVSIFDCEDSRLHKRFEEILGLGFSKTHLIAICLALPFVLSGRRGLRSEDDRLFDDLKKILLQSDLANSHCLDLCYENCRKVGIFYDIGCEKGKLAEALGEGLSILFQSSEENVIEKVSFFSRLGMKNDDVGWLIVRHPEILTFELKDSIITMPKYLNYIGLDQKSKRAVVREFPHVLGTNRIGNLPEIMQAIGLHGWFGSKILEGGHRFLTGFDTKFATEKSKLNAEIVPTGQTVKNELLIPKIEFLQGVGFGENHITENLALKLHATKEQLHLRFNYFLRLGIKHSEILKMLCLSPKILNQSVAILEEKVEFFQNGLKLSLQDLQKFPGYLLFDLERRVKPRHRIIDCLRERGLLLVSYAPATILASSERRFIEFIKKIHPAAPKQWLESFSCQDQNISMGN